MMEFIAGFSLGTMLASIIVFAISRAACAKSMDNLSAIWKKAMLEQKTMYYEALERAYEKRHI